MAAAGVDIVSIHAPTGGATRVGDARLQRAVFQFTRPRGARRGQDFHFDARRVSIHAPTGGATGCGSQPHNVRRFNSRAHGGRDSLGVTTGCGWTAFQFTRPRGARHVRAGLHRQPFGFNSRAHGGRDHGRGPLRPAGIRFNSRAHGGRDASGLRIDAPGGVSIHAPTGGATYPWDFRGCPRRFNSRAHGGRDVACPFVGAVRMFQFTRPRGARQTFCRTARRHVCFNSRAHGGRDRSPRKGTAK